MKADISCGHVPYHATRDMKGSLEVITKFAEYFTALWPLIRYYGIGRNRATGRESVVGV